MDPINHIGANFFKNLSGSGAAGGQNGGFLAMLSQGFHGSSVDHVAKTLKGLQGLFDQGGAIHSTLGNFSANLSAANTFGANLAGAAGSLAGHFLTQKLFKGRGYASQGSALGSTGGMMLGMALGGPLGAALGSLGGSLIGGGLGSLFGDKKGPTNRSAAFGQNASEALKQDQRRHGFLLENEFGTFSHYADKWFSLADMKEQMQVFIGSLGNMDKAIISSLKMSAVDIEKAKSQLSTLEGRRYDFGIEHTDLLKSSAPLEIARDRYGAILESMAAGWGEMITSFKGSFEALPAHIQQVIAALEKFKTTNAADIFGEKIKDLAKFKPYQQAGESLAQTYTRLNDIFTITNKTAELTGKNIYTAFGKIGLASYELRKQFVDLAGGMEKLAANLADYYENYFTQEEQADFVRREIAKELKAVGLSMPSTRAQFRAMVESLNLNTIEGQKAHAALLNVAGAFAKITKASALDSLNEKYAAQVDIFQKLAADATKYLHYAQRARTMQRGIIDLMNDDQSATDAWKRQRERDIWAMIPNVDIAQQLDFLDELSGLIVARYQKEKELIRQIGESIRQVSDFLKSLKLGDASLVHDVLCQFAKELPIFDAKPPSDLFYRMLLDAGFSKFRAAVYRAAVLNFGPQDWGDLYLSRHA